MLLDTVNALCLRRLGRRPELGAPTGYNDKIQWLKLHDQRVEQVTACDKWAVREMVSAIAGEEILIPAVHGLNPASFPCIAKATHDSGSATWLRSPKDVPAAAASLNRRLKIKYGADKGEWAYDLVPPAIIVEQVIAGAPVDYKFHCVNGVVRWVQVIWNRQTGRPCEAIFSPDGVVTKLHMDEKMRHAPLQSMHPGDVAWSELSGLAERLADGWRYVRVDLYWVCRPFFGELTFWPRAGCYRSKDEPVFGEMLDIDMSYKLPPIVQ